jgi:tetratricopeptide (TPR) repeat protein
MALAQRPAFRLARIAAAAVLLPGLAQAQIPEKFTNLQILPKASTREQVVETMRAFATALGVRCNHCHVGSDPETLEGFDFAADTKQAKRIARAMMRMTQEINERLLPQMGREPEIKVQCITCHHGLAQPETLRDVLAETVATDGVDAALRYYRRLRSRYYGQSAYDFSAVTLNGLAEWLAEARKDLDAAIAVQRFNVETNPGIASSYALLADLYVRKGDRASARTSFQRAAELEPANAYFRKRLEELGR